MDAKAFHEKMMRDDPAYREVHEAARAREVHLVQDKVILRPEPDGSFDELLQMEDGECRVHAEMMSDKCLWIGIYPKDSGDRSVAMRISINKGKLSVLAEDD
jgi:hypothetical protein